MYNSQNLPLSKKKIIKKVLSSWGALPIWIFLVLSPLIYFLGRTLVLADIGKEALIVYMLFFILLLLIFLVAVIYEYLYYKFYYYNFEQDSAEIRKGVVSRSTGHVHYGKIQNIYVDQDFLDRILGLYDVHFETAGEFSSIYSHVDGLVKENADKLTAFLNERIQNANRERKTKIEPSVNVKKNITDENDQRVFTRENLPIDKKVIFSNVVKMISAYLVIIFIIIIGTLSGIDIEKMNKSLMILIVMGVILLIFFGVLIYQIVWYKNYYFKFDKSGGVITEKVLSVNNTYVYFNRVQNIDVTQSIIERLLGLYTVTIETAAEGTSIRSIAITGLNSENAEVLRNFLLEKTKVYQSV